MSAVRKPPPGPPAEPAQVYVLQNALLSKVEVRSLSPTVAVSLRDGVLIGLHPEDGTVDIQVDRGVLRNVQRFSPETVGLKTTWQWPGAEHEWLRPKEK